MSLIKGWLIGLAVAFAAGSAFAQSAPANYPSRTVRLVLPYPPGGGTDTIARRLAGELTTSLGQQVIVENRPGAGGIIGMQDVARAAPDGHTLVLALSAQFAANVTLYSKLPYDPIKDFEPVSLVVTAPYVLVAAPNLPVKNLQELIALAKEKPGQLMYGSAGNGSGAHLSAELLKTMAGIDLVHVPYKGAAETHADLITGKIHLSFLTYGPIADHIAGGRMKALGVTTAKRASGAPSIPTITEAGVPGYASDVWYAVAAPAGTPKEIIAKLHGEIVKALNSEALRKSFASDSMEAIGSSPEQLRAYLPQEIQKWGAVVKASGARLD